jgi:hypothetical protein
MYKPSEQRLHALRAALANVLVGIAWYSAPTVRLINILQELS